MYDEPSPPPGCGFEENVAVPCANEATETRSLSGITVPACPYHAERGGCLNVEAHDWHTDVVAYWREYQVMELRAKEFPDG